MIQEYNDSCENHATSHGGFKSHEISKSNILLVILATVNKDTLCFFVQIYRTSNGLTTIKTVSLTLYNARKFIALRKEHFNFIE
jgi:hypothetical protein